MKNQQELLKAFRASIPVMMGYIPLGMVFGFLFVQAGADWWLAPISSMIIYGGAAQYVMVPMLAAGMSVSAIAIATLILNLRHVFYGLSLIEQFGQHRFLKWVIAVLLTDETYSLLTTQPKDTPIWRSVFLAIFNWIWWVLGSLIGALLGASAKIELAGMDFVLCSLFAMLLCEQWRGRASGWPVPIAFVSYGMAYLISPPHALAVAIFISLVSAFAFHFRSKSQDKEVLNG